MHKHKVHCETINIVFNNSLIETYLADEITGKQSKNKNPISRYKNAAAKVHCSDIFATLFTKKVPETSFTMHSMLVLHGASPESN